ncbi:MAG: phosphoribosyltransferase family protein [Planctomycetota bacterium]
MTWDETADGRIDHRVEIGRTVRRAFPLFVDRKDAGRTLAEFVHAGSDPDARVLAIPRGGVPVAAPLARALGAPLDVVVVWKLPIPSSPEAGFGAVALDGSAVLNDELAAELGLTAPTIAAIEDDVLAEVRRRARQYRGDDRPPDVDGRHVYLVDDGLASGYTMLAAVRSVRRAGAVPVTLCVPVSPIGSLKLVGPHFDQVFCFVAQERPPFAVASFYRDFRDLTDDDVKSLLPGGRGAADEDRRGP